MKFEPGDRGRVIADWSAPGTSGLAPGLKIGFDLDSSLQRVYRTRCGPDRRLPGGEAEIAGYIRRLGAHAAVAAPVTLDGHWGAVAMSTSKPRPFPASAEAQLAFFADSSRWASRTPRSGAS